MWQLEPSAKGYAEIIGRPHGAQVDEGSLFYVITYNVEQAAGDGSVLQQATLTLRKSDLHPIQQTLVLRHGPDVREYRLSEARFEQPSLDATAPAVFEVDPELLPQSINRDSTSVKTEGFAAHPSGVIPSPSVVASPELEVEVAYILDQFRRRFGDQISLKRTSEGVLSVEGTVDTDASKQQILQALTPFLNNPAVSVQISTAAEALQRQQQGPSNQVIVRDFSGSDNTIPVYHELRRYFSRTNTSGPSSDDQLTDQAVRAFASRMVSRSRRMLSHAIELKQLSERFSMVQLNALTPQARVRWLSLIRDHAAALQQESAMLSRDLQPIFFPTEASPPGIEVTDISSDAELVLVIQRVYKLVLVNDEAIRSAFTASSDASGALALKTQRFRVSLASSQRLANSVREGASQK